MAALDAAASEWENQKEKEKNNYGQKNFTRLFFTKEKCNAGEDENQDCQNQKHNLTFFLFLSEIIIAQNRGRVK